jgi:hypothetical protein
VELLRAAHPCTAGREDAECPSQGVERAFGVLQARWEIVRNPVRAWGLETIGDIMMACVILHNMVVQDEQHGDFESVYDLPIRGGSMR